MELKDKKPKLRVSSSIAPFREKAEKVWGLERYCFPRDIFKSVVMFGLYHWADYFHYLAHRGEKTVVWAGSDILNLKTRPYLARFFRKATHYVENEVEKNALRMKGIEAEVRPSFLEDVNDFPVSFKPSENPQVYLSCNKGREEEYGFDLIMKISYKVPEITFHLYGCQKCQNRGNIIFHGRVPPEQFNREIRNYQCGLRTNFRDGFSEITAKSVLLGQYPITRIKYPMIDNYETEEELIKLLKELKNKTEPNIKARDFWRANVNNYDFIKK